MNTPTVQPRGPISTQLRALQDLVRRHTPARSRGILTRRTANGTLRSTYSTIPKDTDETATARWA